MNYIVFGFEHYNPLGIVRSLGENGINSIGIIIRNERKITSKSKYLKKIYFVNSIEEGYRVLINEFAGKNNFVFTSDDQIENYLDEHFDELNDKFYFFNCGKKVDVAVEMNKNSDLGIPVPDYVDENVSDKVVKIIQSYTGVIDKMVWRKY